LETRVGHVSKDQYDVYVGRGSPWGNPYVRRGKARQSAYDVQEVEDPVAAYEAYLKTRPDLLRLLPELRGKILGCWCYKLGERLPSPERCHAQVLARLADGRPAEAPQRPVETSLCESEGCGLPSCTTGVDGAEACLLHALVSSRG